MLTTDEWILHAADQDLPCLAEVGMRPPTLYDTELAGRLAGFDRVNLATMVERRLGFGLAKGHGAADWSKRPLPAEWLNFLFNEQAAAIQTVQEASYLPALQNWYPEVSIATFTGLTGSSIMDACWAPQGTSQPGLWYAAVYDVINSHLQVLETYGLDLGNQSAWLGLTKISTGINSNCAVRPDPTTTGYVWVAYGTTGGGGDIVTQEWQGSSWVSQSTFTQGSAPLPAGTLYCALHSFQGTMYVAIGSLTATGGGVYPAAGGVVVNSFAGVTTGVPLMCDNAGNAGPDNLLLVIPRFAGSNTYWLYNGSVWTSGTLPFSGASNYAFGLVWTEDAVGPCWLLGANNTSSVHTEFYRSADGVNWTFQSEPTNVAQGAGLAAVGHTNSVYCTYTDASSTGPSGGAYSPDGGVTWYPSSAILTGNAAVGAYYQPRYVGASDGGLLSWNTIFYRFSLLAGLPAPLP